MEKSSTASTALGVAEELAMDSSYKKEMPFFLRRTDATDVLQKNPDKIPVVCEPGPMQKTHAVPRDWTVGQFADHIRRVNFISELEPMFMFVKKTQVSDDALMSDLYAQHKDADGYLYMTYHHPRGHLPSRM
ncbi:hypothetical protein ACS0TY_031982 [Phlomoides rotata]